jgi:hypothetical protein
VYVLRAGELVMEPVTLGVTSEAYSEAAGGSLKAGDQIVLNPPAESSFQPGSGRGFQALGGGG